MPYYNSIDVIIHLPYAAMYLKYSEVVLKKERAGLG